jgi:hypothetical protein
MHAGLQRALHQRHVVVAREHHQRHGLLVLQGRHRPDQFFARLRRPAHHHVGLRTQGLAHQMGAIALPGNGEPGRKEVGAQVGRAGIGALEQENGSHERGKNSNRGPRG